MNQKRELEQLYTSVYGQSAGDIFSPYLEDKYNLLKASISVRDAEYKARLQQLLDSYATQQYRLSDFEKQTRKDMEKIANRVLAIGITSVILAVVLVTHLAFVYF